MRAGPVFGVNQNCTTPVETPPIVSQAVSSLVGAKTPVSGEAAGRTAASTSLPAALPSLTALPGTKARGSSSTALLPLSQT